ncbi:MAG: vitamin K epoxide reductase family protein [Planctomycetota bacterium]|nr:vitamin K epoxide reductase family protein [Planctomycetota bacterium]
MPLTRRLIAARAAILVALLASAALTVDHVRPGPGYCPMEQACDQAKASELGTLAGIPTSVLGMAAFALLLLLSLPSRLAIRRLCVMAAALGIAAGIGFLLYQGVKLGTFCPLCVVADSAAVVGGTLLIIDVLFRPARWWRPGESTGAKVAWALGGVIAMLAPFAWPASTSQAEFEEAVPLADATFDELPEPEPAVAIAGRPPVDPPPPAEPPVEPLAHVVPADVSPTSPEGRPPPPPEPDTEPVPVAEPAVRVETVERRLPASDPAPADPIPAPEPAPAAVPAPAAPDAAPTSAATPPDAAPEVPAVRVVGYLNAYCPHCRKMHRRIERVLAASRVPVKHRRIYAWASDDYPLWARACVFARTRGLEDALFEALMETRSDSRRNVMAAARKVGLDTDALSRALTGAPASALIRDRQLSRAARLKGLPTFDIGRRRLTGEQSERALKKALSLAAKDARDAAD